jgi:hypothetical protein
MRGGEEVRRGRFTRKEQTAIDGGGEHGALAGVAGQRVAVITRACG